MKSALKYAPDETSHPNYCKRNADLRSDVLYLSAEDGNAVI